MIYEGRPNARLVLCHLAINLSKDARTTPRTEKPKSPDKCLRQNIPIAMRAPESLWMAMDSRLRLTKVETLHGHHTGRHQNQCTITNSVPFSDLLPGMMYVNHNGKISHPIDGLTSRLHHAKPTSGLST